ncbi:MAG TPA: hypothetical protein PKM57_13035 [Kiritimatiellia bacterium]|nr:hypothetical protein [Kiritimatiellia bacterium]HPS07048.1 hypothetical protein [Kiritimatiellia bacterium]
MRHCVQAAVVSIALFCVQAASAFLPPSDKQDGVTLSIEGFKETTEKDRFSAQEVPTDKPLSFTVTLKNDRAQTVGGTVKVWLNDDWQVNGSDTVTLSAEPGKSASVTCSAAAKASVLSALYPIHARLALALDGQTVDLHPIAIFEAVKPAAAKAAEAQKEAVLGDGVLRLDSGADRRVFCRQKDATVELGINYSGADAASGTHMSRDASTRGGVTRQGFTIHPPYRGGPGATWNEFRLALPAGKPAVLNFHTAIRDQGEKEPSSDGTEHKVIIVGADGQEKELFTRFSASKSWEAASVDLGAYAGQRITLRLWTGPGPKNNTTCDQCFWGDPLVTVGRLPALQTEAEWQALERQAVADARLALSNKPKKGSGAFRLDVRGQRFGAAVALGKQGLTDGVIAFSDGVRELIYRGFACDIDRGGIGGIENGQPVLKVETATEGGAWMVTHAVAQADGDGAPLPARAKLWAEGGALRIAWDMPGVTRDSRGTPRYTRLGLGAGSLPVWRAYAGFGNVIEHPGAFDLSGGGFTLSTRHIGADYTNGLSLVQACDIFPDRLTHAPAARRFALETHHDAAFFFVPSASGAFAAAREYRDLCGFKKGRGVDAILGRVCLDQWGGDYLVAAKDLSEAAKYGVTDAVFVKHVWQRWGYDYRLPEIYPPAGGLEPFLAMRRAAEEAGMLFCPHDNYIDFYPDAERYSYDQIVFHEDGRPVQAWYNKGRRAQSYRWLPHGFRPWLEPNMRLMREGFAPDSLFIDVFTAISPFDYYDRAGVFYPRTRTQREWSDAFDTCRSILKRGAPMISEAGTDALIGSLDAGQADHFPAQRWLKEFGDADRTPWHDMATHGKMVLLAGGLGPRYSAFDWDDHGGKPLHGYGSDDYLSNTVMGGRNPMCDGPFSRRTVMTYWLLHDVCDGLARETFETHAFGATIKQQHTTFSGGGQVWVNRGSNVVWTVAGGKPLPEYGFYAAMPDAEAGVVLIDGQRAGFAKSEDTFFADARPRFNPLRKMKAESSAEAGRYLGDGAFEVTFNWNILDPSLDGYVPFIHVCREGAKDGGSEKIAFQADMRFDRSLLKQAGAFKATARIAVPKDQPAGEYKIRYGLYNHVKGDRLTIRGLADGGQRILGGVLKVAKSGDTFTGGSFTPEADTGDEQALGLNVERRMLDFGPLVTDGAFRLVHAKRGEWLLIPLPGSMAFRAEIDLAAFGAKRAKVQAVESVDPSHSAAQAAVWTQDGATLRLSCDSQAFGYRIVF